MKATAVYQGGGSAGLINQDGTVNATALVNEHNRRNGRQNSALQGNGQNVIIKSNKTNSDRSEKHGNTDTDILEGRKVSASGRGKNRIRTHGANTKIIRGELGNLYRGKGNDDISLAAGETARLSSPDFGPARKMGGGLEESFLRNIQRVVSNGFDSIGRILSPKLQEKVSDAVFMEEDGTVFSFFHWTPKKFDEFKYGDGAFHGGTLQSALAIKNRSEKKVDGYIKEIGFSKYEVDNLVGVNFNGQEGKSNDTGNERTTEQGRYEGDRGIRESSRGRKEENPRNANRVNAEADSIDGSVYLRKNKEDVTQAPDADNVAPETTAETAPPSPSSSPIISREDEKVNSKRVNREKKITPKEEEIVRRVGKALGLEVEFKDLGWADGKITGNKVTINIYAINPVRAVIKHEFTHSFESSKHYSKFQQYVTRNSKAFKQWLKENGFDSTCINRN